MLSLRKTIKKFNFLVKWFKRTVENNRRCPLLKTINCKPTTKKTKRKLKA